MRNLKKWLMSPCSQWTNSGIVLLKNSHHHLILMFALYPTALKRTWQATSPVYGYPRKWSYISWKTVMIIPFSSFFFFFSGVTSAYQRGLHPPFHETDLDLEMGKMLTLTPLLLISLNGVLSTLATHHCNSQRHQVLQVIPIDTCWSYPWLTFQACFQLNTIILALLLMVGCCSWPLLLWDLIVPSTTGGDSRPKMESLVVNYTSTTIQPSRNVIFNQSI